MVPTSHEKVIDVSPPPSAKVPTRTFWHWEEPVANEPSVV